MTNVRCWVCLWIAALAGGCTFLINPSSDPDPEPTVLEFPPSDRNLVMQGHRVVDIDRDGLDDVAIMNGSTVPDDRGVFILLGGQDLEQLVYHTVVPTPAAPRAIAFGDVIDGEEEGLELFVVDQLGSLLVYTFVGGEQVYDPAPISVPLTKRPDLVQPVSMDVGNFDDDPTLEAVVGIGTIVDRVVPDTWSQGALTDAIQDELQTDVFFDFVATVQEADGTDSLLVGSPERARWFTTAQDVFDTPIEDEADSSCRPTDGVTFVADVVESSMGIPAALRSGDKDNSDSVCVTTIDADSRRIITSEWLYVEQEQSSSPVSSRLGFEAVLFGNFAIGPDPEIVVLDRSALSDSQIAVGCDVAFDADSERFVNEIPTISQVMTFLNPELLIPIDFDGDGEGELWLIEDDGSRAVCERVGPDGTLVSCFSR